MGYSSGAQVNGLFISLVHLPFCMSPHVHGVNTTVCDAWPVQRQTYGYGYLPGLGWYQIYTAWWQLTAQDIRAWIRLT